jgi:RNA polymerase-binding transcription factor DksA
MMFSNRKTDFAALPADVSNQYSEERARQLLQLLAGLRSQETQWMRALRERDSLDQADIGDEGDTALSDEGLELTASLAELAGSRAAAVESALARFREGRYGVCDDCDEDIPVERLAAMPAAVLCVDCQRKRETAAKNASIRTAGLWEYEKEQAPSAASIAAEPLPEDGNPEGATEKRRRGRPRLRPADARRPAAAVRVQLRK